MNKKKNFITLMKMKLYLIFIFISLFLTLSTNAAKTPNPAYEFLAKQNVARAALRLPPLTWDAKLASYAALYANKRHLDCALVHSNGPYGENMFWGSGNMWTPANAVASWVAEGRGYNYRSNSCARGGGMCGHYTQIVWRGTRRVGCARVVCYGNRGVFMTCNYDPPGNYAGERPY